MIFKVDVGALTTGLSVVIVKQFAGRGAPPDLVIVMGQERIGLNLGDVIDVGAWPRKGYLIRSFFDGEKFKLPKFWSGVEMTCH